MSSRLTVMTGREQDRVTRLTDPRIIRALAHEARQKLIALVGRGRVVTATEVADELGVSPSAASYHLRQLAKYGLVEPATDPSSDGREKRWQATFDSLVMAPDGEVDHASAVAHLEVFQAAIRQSVLTSLGLPDDAEGAAGVNIGRAQLRLTPARAAELSGRVRAVLAEFDLPATEDGTALVPMDFYYLLAPQDVAGRVTAGNPESQPTAPAG